MSRIEDTIEARGASHGDPEQNACIYTELREAFTTGRRIDPLHEWALDMIAHKLARILTGDPTEPDHWHDIAGYATIVEQSLAGYSGPQVSTPIYEIYEDPPGAQACGCLTDDRPVLVKTLCRDSSGRERVKLRCGRCGREYGEMK